ncbi:Histone H2A [Armadillidium vulgare]|nr:Histone H2A [Armadillidium vulgare]
MWGPGKGGTIKEKPTSRSNRTGLQLPVGRIHSLLRKGNYAERVGEEVLELSGNAARDNNNKKTYCSTHFQLAICNDELNKLLSGVAAQGGVLPNIQVWWSVTKHPSRFIAKE